MESIRRYYGVPAKRGTRIAYRGEGRRWIGTIVAARGHYLRVRLDNCFGQIMTLHPTWEVEYLGGAE